MLGVGFVSADTGATPAPSCRPRPRRKATSRRPLPHRESPRTIASGRSGRTAPRPCTRMLGGRLAEGRCQLRESASSSPRRLATSTPCAAERGWGRAFCGAGMDGSSGRARIAEPERAHGEALRQLEAQAEAEASQAADQTASQPAPSSSWPTSSTSGRNSTPPTRAARAAKRRPRRCASSCVRRPEASTRAAIIPRAGLTQGTRGPRPEGRDPPARPEAACGARGGRSSPRRTRPPNKPARRWRARRSSPLRWPTSRRTASRTTLPPPTLERARRMACGAAASACAPSSARSAFMLRRA